jgi:hypothetical protein
MILSEFEAGSNPNLRYMFMSCLFLEGRLLERGNVTDSSAGTVQPPMSSSVKSGETWTSSKTHRRVGATDLLQTARGLLVG